MKNLLRALTIALLLLCWTPRAHADPHVGAARPTVQAPGLTANQPHVMTDAEMALVVGGQINVGPGLPPPQPPLAAFIQLAEQSHGVPPGQLGDLVGARGVAGFVRFYFPTSSPGLGQIWRP